MDTILVLTFMYDCYYKEAYDYPEDYANENRDREKAKIRQGKDLRLLSIALSKIIITCHIVLGIKYLLLSLLYLDWFAEYRYYDCLIIGRASISGQSYGPTLILVLLTISYSLAYRLLIITKIASLFDYEFFRFIQLSSDEVLWNELQIEKYCEVVERRATKVLMEDSLQDAFKVRYISGSIDAKKYEPQYGKFKFHFDCPFGIELNSILLRLTRTTEAWHDLRTTIGYYPIVLLVLAASAVLYAYMFVVGMMTTEYGFHVNYQNCIQYIERLKPNESSLYSHIYLSKHSYSPSQSYFSVPVVSAYHMVRLTADIIENLYLYIDSYASFSLQTYLFIVLVIDLDAYLRLLKQKFIKTIDTLRQRSLMEVMMSAHMNSLHLESPIAIDQRRISISDGASDYCANTTQAHLLDYLRMVNKYQVYVRYQIIAIWVVWLILTAGYSIWLTFHKFEELQSVFRWNFIILGFIAVSSMSVCAVYESRARKLYNLVCTAMAVDEDLVGTKQRWCYMIQYFFPKPLYTFTAFDATKFSWLFVMQLIVWIATASLFVSNFNAIYST